MRLEKFLSFYSFFLAKKIILILPFLAGAMFFLFIVKAEATCSDPGCDLLMDWHECVPEGTSSPPCYYDGANHTYLLFQRDTGAGNCTTTNGEPGWWFWRAQWTEECGTCCTGSSSGSCACAPCIPCGCGVEALGPESQRLAENSQQEFLSTPANINASDSIDSAEEPSSKVFFAERLMASIFFWTDKIWDALESFFIAILNIAH